MKLPYDFHPIELSSNRNGGTGGGGGLHPPQVYADHLTLSQQEGTDYAHQLLRTPSDFHHFRHPEQYE